MLAKQFTQPRITFTSYGQDTIWSETRHIIGTGVVMADEVVPYVYLPLSVLHIVHSLIFILVC